MATTTSRFFAYLERLRWIKRWGLKRNVIEENVMEHSWQVATIAHVLAILRNKRYGGNVNAERCATAALYHDCSEVITGDMPTPIKYHSEKITQAYKAIEDEAEQELWSSLPSDLQGEMKSFLLHQAQAPEISNILKAADTISAYLKCRAEIDAGNHEFSSALDTIELKIRNRPEPEVHDFMRLFVDSYQMTIDELLRSHDAELE